MDTIVSTLFDWYEAHHRLLPWRETHDAYAIWVSEIILQQTRVAQGLEYWHRFMAAFPTVEALASATSDEVMQVWQGLGYYSRARNMQAAARQVVEQGGFPHTLEGLLALKGVGPYTAAAVGSFAFDLPLAAVDGNVTRVLARLFAVTDPVDGTSGTRQIRALAEALMPSEHPALFNQAMMEFGALMCTPARPDCADCPLSGTCMALEQHIVDTLPVKGHRQRVTDRYFHYYYIHNADSCYLHLREGNDIWKGLYELPLREVDAAHDEEECLLPVRRVRHVLSHQVIHATRYDQYLPDEVLPAREGCIVVSRTEMDRYPVSRLIQLLLED